MAGVEGLLEVRVAEAELGEIASEAAVGGSLSGSRWAKSGRGPVGVDQADDADLLPAGTGRRRHLSRPSSKPSKKNRHDSSTESGSCRQR